MATDRNVYELVDEFTAFGQQMKNVYFYQIGTGLSFNAQNLADDWVGDQLTTIRAAQRPNVVHTRVAVRNLFDPSETGEVLHSLAGTNGTSGDNLPPFVAAALTLARASSATHSGKKRLYVGNESYHAEGVWSSEMLTLLQAIATKFASAITVSLVQRWFPVIVKRIVVSAGKYRLPLTQSEAIINGVDSGLYSSLVTTQNSRKIGVGS